MGGASGLVTKPLNIREFVQMIEEILLASPALRSARVLSMGPNRRQQTVDAVVRANRARHAGRPNGCRAFAIVSPSSLTAWKAHPRADASEGASPCQLGRQCPIPISTTCE